MELHGDAPAEARKDEGCDEEESDIGDSSVGCYLNRHHEGL